MNLTKEDLESIRAILKEEIKPLEGRLESIEEDMIVLKGRVKKGFDKLNSEIEALNSYINTNAPIS